MRALLISSLIAGLSFSTVASAQEDTGETVVDEEIVIEGRRNLSRQVEKGFTAFREGRFEEAETYFYRVRAGYQLQASQTFEQFADLWSFANLTGATSVYTTTSDYEVRRALAIVHYMEGMSQRAQGDFMGARRSLKRAISVNPGHFDARADLALIEIERGKAPVTEKHIKRLAKDLNRCDANKVADVCAAINNRLLEVEQAYGRAVSG